MTLSRNDVETLGTGNVLVVGDVMVDHYVSGGVSRVSDEAPVPILRVEAERWTPGGAANVAANISALGGHVALIGVIGPDAAGDTLDRLMATLGSPVRANFILEPDRPTTLKTRYMGGQHQLVRVDREQNQVIARDTEAQVIELLGKLIPTVKTLVLSDYAKGVVTDRVARAAIERARAAGVVVLVDPKRTDWSIYAGADYITPNRRELTAATGMPCSTDAEAAAGAAAAISMTGSSILLTRSEKGMALYRPGLATVHLPAKAREVFDVSGAGDTVVAAAALAMASGLDPEAAVAIANIAAGIVVGKRGTATASQQEILADLGGARLTGAYGGALSLAEATVLRQSWAREGLSVGFTNGCFDLLHPGHISLLRQAAEACDRLIVALNADASVARLKGPTRPVQGETARAAVMAAVKGVDAVVIFSEDTPLEAITALEPDVLIKGADYAEADIVGAEFVRARGGRILRASLVDGQSTSRIVQKTART